MAITQHAAHYIGKVEMEAIDLRGSLLQKITFYERCRNTAKTELPPEEVPKAKAYLEKRIQQLHADFRIRADRSSLIRS